MFIFGNRSRRNVKEMKRNYVGWDAEKSSRSEDFLVLGVKSLKAVFVE